MRLTRTSIEVHRDDKASPAAARMRRGVSLHSHSSCSRERLSFVPGIARELPVVGRLFDRSVAQIGRALGRPLDFEHVYWRPPASPESVIASERRQIEDRLGLGALVALTDHDTLDGPRQLRAIGVDVPLSVEWSIRVDETVLHLGVHNIDPGRFVEARALLAQSDAGATPGMVTDILDWLAADPGTFVILNHPFWDFAQAGALRHEGILLSFLRRHHRRVHALELNGYRRWAENRRVFPLADAFELAVVAGGDRHGHAPNAMINVTDADSFAEFAHQLRAGRPTTCVVFPEYFEPFPARVFAGFRDALRPDADPSGVQRRTWCDRVFVSLDGIERPIASVWPRGGPLWLHGAIQLTRLLGTVPLPSLFRTSVSNLRHLA